MPTQPRKSKPVVKKGAASVAVPLSHRAAAAVKSAPKKAAASAANIFEGRAFAYTYEMATGQIVSRGDSVCRDKHPYQVRAEYLNNPENAGTGKSVVLLSFTEIPITDYDTLVASLADKGKV